VVWLTLALPGLAQLTEHVEHLPLQTQLRRRFTEGALQKLRQQVTIPCGQRDIALEGDLSSTAIDGDLLDGPACPTDADIHPGFVGEGDGVRVNRAVEASSNAHGEPNRLKHGIASPGGVGLSSVLARCNPLMLGLCHLAA